MKFTRYDLAAWPRTEYFNYYKKLIKTRYNITVRLDITALKKALEQRQLKLYPALVWAAATAVNRHEQFRTAVDADGNLGYYDLCHPAYTVLHKDTGTFSDLWSEYDVSFRRFYNNMTEDMRLYGDVHRLKGKPDCPRNFTSMSMVPWLDFTGYGCDTYGESNMYFPVLLFGKFTEENGKITLPFNVWIDHCVCDGWHVHLLLQDLEELLQKPETWLDA